MIVRLWEAEVQPSDMQQYGEWEKTRSLPMFEKLPGCLGVLFLRSANSCFALSFWKDMESVDALESNQLYKATSAAYEQSGMLRGSPTLTVFETALGSLKEELVATAESVRSAQR
jgi:heme-degrading monooxygenase HmoA